MLGHRSVTLAERYAHLAQLVLRTAAHENETAHAKGTVSAETRARHTGFGTSGLRLRRPTLYPTELVALSDAAGTLPTKLRLRNPRGDARWTIPEGGRETWPDGEGSGMPSACSFSRTGSRHRDPGPRAPLRGRWAQRRGVVLSLMLAGAVAGAGALGGAREGTRIPRRKASSASRRRRPPRMRSIRRRSPTRAGRGSGRCR